MTEMYTRQHCGLIIHEFVNRETAMLSNVHCGLCHRAIPNHTKYCSGRLREIYVFTHNLVDNSCCPCGQISQSQPNFTILEYLEYLELGHFCDVLTSVLTLTFSVPVLDIFSSVRSSSGYHGLLPVSYTHLTLPTIYSV